ncbi:sulfotransferase family protein [Tahibacter aquaticus]|uniref:Sulfotransferase family protein n=1 Tax=Tahibacter aquaticus TaxID=520092 RepID=A0A4R6Z6U2_9GAMM|nr:sulfotransferase [Tahibacter aquaticus]TDR47498.1 sulfotransferase family protein [Tahibacter aquaticus]
MSLGLDDAGTPAVADGAAGATPHPRDRPVFIVGTERSGSNLLRLALNAHSAISVPHPPHLLRYFLPLLPRYGDLAQLHRRQRLVRDALRLVRWHIHPWQTLPDAAWILREMRTPDLLGLYDAIQYWHAQQQRKPRWGCKSTFAIHQIDALADYYPAARFLWLIRDPRDVAASSKQSVFNPNVALNTAVLWQQQQQLGLAAWQRYGAQRILRLHYEALVGDPAPAFVQICAFLGLPFEASMLSAFSGDEARIAARLSSSWANVAKPISTTSVQAYRRRLTLREAQDVEGHTAELLQTLGYALPLRPPRPSRWRYARARLVEPLHALKTELRAVLRDRNVLLRWRRALLLRYLGLCR